MYECNEIHTHVYIHAPFCLSGHHRRTLIGNKLTINDVSMVDIGNYACNATSDTGYAYGQAVLNVIRKSCDYLLLLEKI